MAAVHSTARGAGRVTGSFSPLSPETPTNPGLAGASNSRRRRRNPASGAESPVQAPIAPPPGHDVPGVAQDLGGLVAQLREELPLRLEEAAYRAWISPAYWRAIEQGRRLPSLAVFIMLARALGLDPRELLEALLERMHYGKGAPPVFQPPIRNASKHAEMEAEYQRLLAAGRSFAQTTDTASKRSAEGRSRTSK